MGNTHPEIEVRRLADEYMAGQPLPLLMPDTGKKYPANGVPFTGYRLSRQGNDEPVALPGGMSPVTGGKSSWAFWLTALDWDAEATVDTGSYVAPYAGRGPQPLPEYLKGSHGRACAARSGPATEPQERRVHVIGELSTPHAVYLTR